METATQHPDSIIVHSYREYRSCILNYITYRISRQCEAEDLVQDVFVRLLDYRAMLRPETVKYFLYTIARNLVTDHLRRYYKKQEIDSYLYDTVSISSNETEERIMTNDLLVIEQKKLATLPAQRRRIYSLSRFDEKNVTEIAGELNLSKRTVENHLLLGRREVRGYFRECI